MLPYWLLSILGMALLGAVAPAFSQTLRLAPPGQDMAQVEAGVGEVVEVEVRADLGRFSASGISLHVRLPAGPFAVVDQGNSPKGVHPFATGPLFAGALEAQNLLTPGQQAPGLSPDEQLLTYSLVLGPGGRRGRTGTGVVARFELLCLQPVAATTIAILSDPVYESFLVLADGRTEQHFRAVQGLEIHVVPLTLVREGDSWGSVKAQLAD
jgi:hypothetical protein